MFLYDAFFAFGLLLAYLAVGLWVLNLTSVFRARFDSPIVLIVWPIWLPVLTMLFMVERLVTRSK